MDNSIYSEERYLFETNHACGRYTLITSKEKLSKRFDLKKKPSKEIKANFNAAPTQQMPIILDRGDGSELEIMKWGFTPKWAKDDRIAYKLFNTRAETIGDKPMWKSAFTSKRCLVPATGFYEWVKDSKEKTPMYIHLKSVELFAFAGIYDEWTNTSTGEVHKSFSIITTTPNKLMKAIHDRMPVILDARAEDDWIDPRSNDNIGFLEHLLKSYPSGEMAAYEVDKQVGSVKNNSPELVTPHGTD